MYPTSSATASRDLTVDQCSSSSESEISIALATLVISGRSDHGSTSSSSPSTLSSGEAKGWNPHQYNDSSKTLSYGAASGFSCARDLGRLGDPKKSIIYRVPLIIERTRDFPAVSSAVLAGFDSSLQGLSLEHAIETLNSRLPAMVRGILAIDVASSSPTSLPTADGFRLCFVVPAEEGDVIYPTHMLSVSHLEGGPALIRAGHALVMTAHCATNFGSYPPPEHLKPDETGRLDIPIAYLRVPHPESFEALYTYLYTKSLGQLCAGLLPLPTEVGPRLLSANAEPSLPGASGLRLVDEIRMAYTTEGMLERMDFLLGFRENVFHLGVAEDGVWKAMNILCSALRVALGMQPDVRVVLPRRSTS